jgi:hypothetical protein
MHGHFLKDGTMGSKAKLMEVDSLKEVFSLPKNDW